MLSRIIKSFLKIGTIGFGGGSALVPVVEKEVVENHKIITDEEYTDYVIVANITPGALPVKLAQGIGNKVAGIWGGILGALSVALPGSFLCVILLSVLSFLSDNVLKQFEFLSFGIAAFIIFLILLYIKKVIKDSRSYSFFWQSITITIASFLLTFGKEIREFIKILSGNVIHFKAGPIFDIQIVDLLLLVFFVVFFISGKQNKVKNIITVAVSVFYLLSVGKTPLIYFPFIKPVLYISLAILSVAGVYINSKGEENSGGKLKLKTPLLTAATYFSIIVVLLALSSIFIKFSDGKSVLDFAINGAISTASSFGGGEAYLTVAQGVFVDNGFLSSDIFYKQIVPIANTLPGPILVKILAGVGYCLGFANSNNILFGYLFALLGLSIGVGVSSSVFCFVYMIYNKFKSLSVFTELKKWILPVICGLLLSTILSMLIEMQKTTLLKQINPFISLALFFVVLVVNYFLHKKYKLNDTLLIAISGIVSLGLINIL